MLQKQGFFSLKSHSALADKKNRNSAFLLKLNSVPRVLLTWWIWQIFHPTPTPFFLCFTHKLFHAIWYHEAFSVNNLKSNKLQMQKVLFSIFEEKWFLPIFIQNPRRFLFYLIPPSFIQNPHSLRGFSTKLGGFQLN